MSLQLFVWVGQGQTTADGNKVHYQSFTLNDQTYNVGDSVYLFPEDELYPPYIARILAAFVDKDVQSGADPHCIEVKWYERRVNLEPTTKGIEESEREVFELDDTDVNPIGCISGKCRIIKAHNYEEAYGCCGNTAGWFFCRGYFQQSTNAFVAYTPAEMALARAGMEPATVQAPLLEELPAAKPPALPGLPRASGQAAAEPSHRAASQRGGGGGGWANGEEEEEDDEDDSDAPPPNPRRGHGQQHNPPPQQQQPPNKRQKATGRTCVECGATTTPQWREGPMGPKTLCNACGVRYVRSQQKAAGQKRSSGGQKNGQGRPQEPTPPRAQQTSRVSRRGTSPKASPSAPPTSGAAKGVSVP